MLGTVAVYTSALPAVTGAVRWRHLDSAQRAVAIWVAFLFAQNVLLRLLAWQGTPTRVATWYAYPISVWLGLTALLAFPAMSHHRAIRSPLALTFLAVWLLGPVIGDHQAGYSHFVAPIHAFMLAAVAALVLVISGGRPEFRWSSASSSAAIATVLCYGPFVAVWPASALLSASRPEWILPIWETRAMLLIVGAFFFTRSLR